ncbi:hypothetical protein CHARACLAT_013484 [Characodon lateralis]|uniref:Uncharacterized protein n=1 Tax=Characodon lateralis TaxID=208331 RepID=A0ABU7D6E5_9TELE|nr:hypothetical protein [Characodon lateralis]
MEKRLYSTNRVLCGTLRSDYKEKRGRALLEMDFFFAEVRMGVCTVVYPVCPCDGLVTCPGCTPPLVCRPLEIGTSSPVILNGRNGKRI